MLLASLGTLNKGAILQVYIWVQTGLKGLHGDGSICGDMDRQWCKALRALQPQSLPVHALISQEMWLLG